MESEADFTKKASCTHDLGTASKNSQSLTIQRVDLSSKFDQLKRTIAILTADTAATQNAITEERPEVLEKRRTTRQCQRPTSSGDRVRPTDHAANLAHSVGSLGRCQLGAGQPGHKKGASSVTSLIEQIIEDSAAEEREAKDAEVEGWRCRRKQVLNLVTTERQLSSRRNLLIPAAWPTFVASGRCGARFPLELPKKIPLTLKDEPFRVAKQPVLLQR